jgi:hypothetical protein
MNDLNASNLQSPISNRQKGGSAIGHRRWGFSLMPLFAMLIPFVARAQSSGNGGGNGGSFDFGINSIGQILALPEGDPREIAVRLINVALEFLAILMLVLVVWSGFLFLLSGGKQENIDRAVGTLKNAIIGLIIILSSWAIVQFVIRSFIGAINGTPTGG